MTGREQAERELAATIDKLAGQLDLPPMMRHRRKEYCSRMGVIMKQRMTFDEDGTAHIHMTPDMQYHVFDDMNLCWMCGAECTEHTKDMRFAAFVSSLPYMEPLHLKKTFG